jgi:UDP-N-acetylmuramoyl-tripeptide--D-alanyl-D-alanine ligase
MSARESLWSSEEAAAATKGRSAVAWNAYGVSIDTRTLQSGDLFVALQGDNRDGHEFVPAALSKGAAAALVSRALKDLAADAPLLLVGDTQQGLEALGRASRERSSAKIVAVTGSAGKTTTKEMLRLILAGAGSVAASAASYNNHWGVPLSLARMPRTSGYGVFELGMNHEGEIRALVKQVRPHVAIITTIAPAHLEYFGSLEAIADAKAEIFEGIEPGGSAILPADNSQYGQLKKRASSAGVSRILSFGRSAGADARLLSMRDHPAGQEVVAEFGGERITFLVGASGTHIAMNAIASLLAARELDVDTRRGASALAEFVALKGRGAKFTAAGVEIIDEAYNANPASMGAALELLGNAQPGAGGRRIAVLGDMLELGPQSKALHRSLSAPLSSVRADLVFLCGPQMASLWEALPPHSRGGYAEKSSELAPLVVRAARAGDVVLVKGSFGSRMSVIIDALKARQTAAA